MSHPQSSTAFAPDSSTATVQSGASLIAFRSHQRADWFVKADACLTGLLSLSPNWNSYEAKPADHLSIEAAQALVGSLSEIVSVREPEVGLTPDGTATLSWELDVSREVEVEVDATGAMSINHFDDTTDLHQSFRTRDFGQLVELLTRWGQEG